MKNVVLLGATGSIGMQVINVIKKNKQKFRLTGIAFGKNIEKANIIIEDFKSEIKIICTLGSEDAALLKKKYPSLHIVHGESGLLEVAKYVFDSKGTEYFVNALVGSIGLMPTIEAIKHKKTILLANKETLVMAGEVIMSLAKEYKVNIIPIDSEHSGVFQIVNNNSKNITRIILTASGGAFRDYPKDELENVTIADALKHPNWKMGNKITVDCATMVNKGFEIIEAHHLFGIDYDNIEAIMHKESIIHALVEYVDGSVIAQFANPDMMLPISYALAYPKRIKNDVKKIDLNAISSLNFKNIDKEKYPCLDLAYKVGKMGGLMPAVYNAANDIAVSLFLNGKIKFTQIKTIIFKCVAGAACRNIANPTLEDIISVSEQIKNEILRKYEVN